MQASFFIEASGCAMMNRHKQCSFFIDSLLIISIHFYCSIPDIKVHGRFMHHLMNLVNPRSINILQIGHGVYQSISCNILSIRDYFIKQTINIIQVFNF